MLKLIKKEFVLAMHPITPVMLLLSAMTLIPNYPYTVIFFYVTMAVFFTCLLGRENNDVVYSLNLPVSKKSVVTARVAYTIIIELMQLLIMIPFVLLSRRLTPAGNEAGMDANLALFASGLIVYALFNLVFFTNYYKDVAKVGAAFVKSSVLIFILVAVDVASSYAIPLVRDRLDTPDPLFMTDKLVYLAVAAAIYAILTYFTLKSSIKRFEKQDLS